MKLFNVAAAGALALTTLIAAPASATIVFTSQGLSTYDSLTTFDTPALATNTIVTNQFAGMTFAATGNGGVRYNSCPNNWNSGYPGISGAHINTYGPSCTTNGTNDSFTLTFDSAVTAVSIGLYSQGGSTGRMWQTYLGNTLIETFANNTGSFNGFLSLSGYSFDRIRFTEGSSPSSYLVMDNIARVNAVPEPAALAFLGLGVLGLAARRRRKVA